MEVRDVGAERGSVADCEETARYVSSFGSQWIIVDGYHFMSAYHSSLKRAGYSVLHIDDGMHLGRYHADIVLDQNICASDERYADREPYTRLLLGTQYAMLRHEFTQSGSRKRDIPEVARNILMTIGGADQQNITLHLLLELGRIDLGGAEISVVAGSINPNVDTLAEAVTRMKCKVTLTTNVHDMHALMRRADIAVAAAGSTCWELCYMGLPSILVVAAENQKRIASELASRGVALSMGRFGTFADEDFGIAMARLARDREMRSRFSQTGQQLVDGKGAQRVVSYLKDEM